MLNLGPLSSQTIFKFISHNICRSHMIDLCGSTFSIFQCVFHPALESKTLILFTLSLLKPTYSLKDKSTFNIEIPNQVKIIATLPNQIMFRGQQTSTICSFFLDDLSRINLFFFRFLRICRVVQYGGHQHVWLLWTWNMASPNWDVLQM